MPAPIVDLMELIKTALNAASFTTDLTAVRAHVPRNQQHELTTTPRLCIFPGTSARGIEHKPGSSENFEVRIAVLAKLGTGQGAGTDDTETITKADELLNLIDELDRFFIPEDGEPYSLGDYEASEIKADPLFDPMKAEEGIFYTMLAVSFAREWY